MLPEFIKTLIIYNFSAIYNNIKVIGRYFIRGFLKLLINGKLYFLTPVIRGSGRPFTLLSRFIPVGVIKRPFKIFRNFRNYRNLF